jgi:hypothetical protein
MRVLGDAARAEVQTHAAAHRVVHKQRPGGLHLP